MNKIIIGLDLATNTGWCVLKNGLYHASGVQDFSKKRGESNGLMFMRFDKWLNDLIKLMVPASILIAYEQAHMRGGAATEICVGLQTNTQRVAATYGMESAPVMTTTLKKFALGKGRGEKTEMVQAANAWFQKTNIPTVPSITSDDEADAIHVARWAMNEYGQPLDK